MVQHLVSSSVVIGALGVDTPSLTNVLGGSSFILSGLKDFIVKLNKKTLVS